MKVELLSLRDGFLHRSGRRRSTTKGRRSSVKKNQNALLDELNLNVMVGGARVSMSSNIMNLQLLQSTADRRLSLRAP